MPNMAGQWSIGLLALALLPWAQALPSPTPLPTISQPSVISKPSPTPTHTLHPRATATASDTDDESDDPEYTVTSTAPPNVCGYFDGKLSCKYQGPSLHGYETELRILLVSWPGPLRR